MAQDRLNAFIYIAVDTYKSTAIEIPVWAQSAVVKVPAIDNGTLTIEMIDPVDVTPAKLAPDSDTDWCTAYSDEGRTDILGVGLDPAFVNITPYIGGFPQSGFMRFVCTASQSSDKQFIVHFRS